MRQKSIIWGSWWKWQDIDRQEKIFWSISASECKICPCCGNAQNSKKRFCEVCHTKLPGSTIFDIYKSKHRCCKKCGNVLPDDAEYCPLCGTKQSNKNWKINLVCCISENLDTYSAKNFNDFNRFRAIYCNFTVWITKFVNILYFFPYYLVSIKTSQIKINVV